MKSLVPTLLLVIAVTLSVGSDAIARQQTPPPPANTADGQSLHIRRIFYKPLGTLATDELGMIVEHAQQTGACPKVETTYDPAKVTACEAALRDAWKARGVDVTVKSETTRLANSHAVEIRFVIYKQ